MYEIRVGTELMCWRFSLSWRIARPNVQLCDDFRQWGISKEQSLVLFYPLFHFGTASFLVQDLKQVAWRHEEGLIQDLYALVLA